MAHDGPVQIAAASPARSRACGANASRGRDGGETSRRFRLWLNAGSVRASADHLVGVGVGHIETKIGNHTLQATGVTAYLENGGTLEKAATMANHASASTMLS